jgi:isopenicillin-N N-acyltransferase like protein
VPPTPVLDLCGRPHEIGRQHGQAQRARIRAFLDDRLARINAVLPLPTSLTKLAPTLAAYRRCIAAVMPRMIDELDGLAEGAGVDADEALLLQLRREITGYRSVAAAGDCSTLTVPSVDGRLVAQTIDLNGAVAGELSLLRIAHARGGRRVLMLSFTGLLGYLGMNDRGLAIGLNLLLAGQWGPGIPGYMAIRYLLDEAGDVEQALKLLRRLPLASSRSFTLCDARRSVVVECAAGRLHELGGHVGAHTNHFLAPELSRLDEINPFAKTSSMRRLAVCTDWLRSGHARLDASALFELFAQPPLYLAPSDDPRRECTVAAVVMNPSRGWMQVRFDPARDPVTLSVANETQPA